MTLTLDHLVVGAADLHVGRDWAIRTLGLAPAVGGRHRFMGTHNLVLRLDDPDRELYLEILAIEPDTPDPARPRWFGLDERAVRAALAGSGARIGGCGTAAAMRRTCRMSTMLVAELPTVMARLATGGSTLCHVVRYP